MSREIFETNFSLDLCVSRKKPLAYAQNPLAYENKNATPRPFRLILLRAKLAATEVLYDELTSGHATQAEVLAQHELQQNCTTKRKNIA